MNVVRASRPTLRRVTAVGAGLSAIVFLSLATDALLHAADVLPLAGRLMSGSDWLLATAYRAAYSILGCWVTAWLAPDRPRRHAMALGLVGLGAGLAGFVATRGRGPDFGPAWYALLLLALPLPCAWLGAKLYVLFAMPKAATSREAKRSAQVRSGSNRGS